MGGGRGARRGWALTISAFRMGAYSNKYGYFFKEVYGGQLGEFVRGYRDLNE